MIFQALGKFRKNENFRENLEKYRNFQFHRREREMGWRGTLRVLRAETWLTVYRTIAMTRRAEVSLLEEEYRNSNS